MTTLKLTSADPARLDVDVLVIAVGSGPSGPELLDGGALPAGLRLTVTASAGALGVTGEAGSLTDRKSVV